jgi:hypothetical protein
MPPFGSPLSRHRTWIALLLVGFVTFRYIQGLWTGFHAGAVGEIHGLFYLALLAGLAFRSPTARWIALGLAVDGVRTELFFVPHFHHYTGLAIQGALLLVLLPWGRREATLGSLALACLGASWFATWTFFGINNTPYAGLEPGALALPLYLAGSACVLARHWIGSLLLVTAAATVYAFTTRFGVPVFGMTGALACAAAALFALPGARQGHVGRLHAFAA